ncbi:MAG: cytochrome c4 [Gammaproteobacteria bacterium]|nr:cytochrome c4 [Gammaproteobacteria bacterium]
MIYKTLITVFAALALTSVSVAAGNADAGKAKAANCAGCHGVNGNSTNPAWPKLAGQHADYISKQLADFKAGKQRMEPLMVAQVANLTPEDMADLGAYFAKQTGSQGGTDEKLMSAGEKLYRGGDKKKGIAACIACHGPTGAGNPAAKFPKLSGQHAAYVEKAMNDFRSGARTNDMNKMMQNVAEKMSDKEIKAVASYISGLH